MKRTPACLLALMICAAALPGCAKPAPADASAAEPTELVVFAAASMTEAMTEIAALYAAVEPGIRIVYNFDSSGTLKSQIQAGADCDIFISAGQKQMDQLDAAADAAVNTEGLDCILPGSRFNLVGNEVVLIVPADSNRDIRAFEDVLTDRVGLVALGGADVPAGQYAEEVYTALGLWDALLAANKLSYGSNVKEVLAQVAAGAADCGVVYGTDAAAAADVRVAATAPPDSHRPIVYPAAIVKSTRQRAAAEAFAAYLKGADCAAVFTRAGFTVPGA